MIHSPTLVARLAKRTRIDPVTGCHLWTGTSLPKGYGQIYVGTVDGVIVRGYVHRVAYELARGPIPDGLHIDHLCRNPSCCNPAHLEAVSPTENLMRGFGPAASHARQTQCSRGHDYTPANTMLDKRGWRRCRTCDAAWKRKDWERRKAEAKCNRI